MKRLSDSKESGTAISNLHKLNLWEESNKSINTKNNVGLQKPNMFGGISRLGVNSRPKNSFLNHKFTNNK